MPPADPSSPPAARREEPAPVEPVPVENQAMDDTVPPGDSPSPYTRRLWKAAAIASIVVAAFLVLCYAPEAALLVFAAVWFGCALVQCAKGLGRHTKMSQRWNLAIVVTLLVAALLAITLTAGWRIGGRVNELAGSLSEARTTIEKRLQEGLDTADAAQTSEAEKNGEAPPGPDGEAAQNGQAGQGGETGQEGRGGEAGEGEQPRGAAGRLMDAIPDPMTLVGGMMGGGSGSSTSPAQRVFTAPFTFAIYVLFIFFTGLFLAINPAMYRDGAVSLFPDRQRGKLREVMNYSAEALWAWTKARLVAMAITGTLTGLALWALGIPLALTLAFLTALLVFVPNIGSLLAAVPPVLIAFQQGGLTPLWVLLAYVGVQMLESYVITPYVIGEGTGVPPALVITGQLVFGILFGALGVLFATPMILVAMIFITRYWINSALGHREVDPPGVED
ncbi:AI-2E family transporter [Alienimonas sp. DA493]|uniref:AI-2E family transporter n=1 Tax=Alienimonas sp. DA493 TaxID=3373605 RepID=UPI00375475D9